MEVQKFKNKVIIQPNKFSRAEYSFHPIQRNGVHMIQELVNKDTELQKSWKITKESFADFLRVKKRGMKINWDKSLVDIFQKTTIVVEIETGVYQGISLFDAKFDENLNELELTIRDESLFIFYPLLPNAIEKEPEKNYTKIENEALKNINSPMAKKLYEILSSYPFGGAKDSPVTISINKLRLQLGVSESHDVVVQDGLFSFKVKDIVHLKYKEWRNLSVALSRAIKEINKLETCNIKEVSMFTKKRGKKVTDVEFIYFNTNGIKNKNIQQLIEEIGFTKNQAIKIVRVYGDGSLSEVNKRFNKVGIHEKNPSGQKIYYKKKDNIKINNITAFIVSLFQDILK